MSLKTSCTLIFQAITIDTTSRIIDSLKPKTSTGVDSVSNKLLKFAKNVISEPLTFGRKNCYHYALYTAIKTDRNSAVKLLAFIKIYFYLP